MRVFILRFSTRSRLESAFERVCEAPLVASCAVEPETLRLSFMAAARAADVLVEAIYLEGGLAWCSRHEVVEVRPPEGGRSIK